MICHDGWSTVMNKIFADWNSDAERCLMKEGYAHTETHVTQALVSCEAISMDEEGSVANSFRRRIWKPDVAKDERPMFLYHGGNKYKHITFGCIHCQRATSLYPSKPSFMANLKKYFP